MSSQRSQVWEDNIDNRLLISEFLARLNGRLSSRHLEPPAVKEDERPFPLHPKLANKSPRFDAEPLASVGRIGSVNSTTSSTAFNSPSAICTPIPIVTESLSTSLTILLAIRSNTPILEHAQNEVAARAGETSEVNPRTPDQQANLDSEIKPILSLPESAFIQMYPSDHKTLT